jgi:hypothetical protein
MSVVFLDKVARVRRVVSFSFRLAILLFENEKRSKKGKTTENI